jgi:hypothetical protein
MDFTLYSRGTGEVFTGGDAWCRIDERGLLIVSTGDGSERTCSPGGWDYIEQAASTGSGHG